MKYILLTTLAAAALVSGCETQGAQNASVNMSEPWQTTPASKIWDDKTWGDEVAQNFSHLPLILKEIYLSVKPSGTAQYDDLRELDRGYMLLRQGQNQKALEVFNRLASIRYTEETNFAPWGGQAEAYCATGKKTAGLAVINNMQCEADLSTSKKTCAQMDKEFAQKKPGFPTECYQEICGSEFIRPDYDEVAASLDPSSASELTAPDSNHFKYQKFIDGLKKQCTAK
jgi:hypothetical protein